MSGIVEAAARALYERDRSAGSLPAIAPDWGSGRDEWAEIQETYVVVAEVALKGAGIGLSDQAAADRPDLVALRAELTALMASVSMRSAGDIASLLGLLLSYVPMHDWSALEADLRREFHAPGRAIVPTDRTG